MGETAKRKATKNIGVYTLTSTVRKHNGKADVCYYITYKGGDRKIWEKVGWASEGFRQSSAVELRQERMREKSTGMPVTPRSRKIAFKAAYEEYKTTHIPSLKEGKLLESLADRYILPRFGSRPMAGITGLELERFKSALFAEGLAAQSVKHILGLIRRVYNKAVKWGIYNGPMPTMQVDMPRVDAERMRYLTREEATALLSDLRTRDPLWHDIVLLTLFTGLRPRDALRLRGRQINFAAGYIDVLESKPGTYTAYFPANVRDMLLYRIGDDKNALVFPSPRTGGVLVNTTSKSFRDAVKACKLNDGVTDPRDTVVLYTMRHTFASWLAQENVSLQKIAELMGHTSTRMTERYAKLSKSSLKGAINTIAAHVTPAPDSGSEKT